MRLEYVEGGSAKFWEGQQNGTSVTVRWGRIGTAGQTKDKDFADDESARSFLDKQVAEKKRKGYKETGAPETEVRPLEPVASTRSAQSAPTPAAPPAPADEDAFILSPGLAKQVLPRHDRGPAKRRPDPQADAAFDDVLAKDSSTVRAIIKHARTEPDLRAAAERYLARDPDPLGAAVVAAAIGTRVNWRRTDTMSHVGAGWIARHGTVFAAAACVEMAGVAFSQNGREGLHMRRRRDDEGLGWSWTGEPAVLKVRSALASAEDYAAGVAAIGERRATQAQRVVAAFLAPTEDAWVDEACAEAAQGGNSRTSELWMTLCALRTPEQFAQLEPHLSTWDLARQPRALPTLVAAIGPAIAPALVGHLQQADADFTRKLLSVLGDLPTDQAFDLLLDRLDEKYVQPVVLDAMKRYPRRAVRLLARRTTPTADALLRAHLVTHPDLAHPDSGVELDARERARVEAALAATERLPDAPADLLPDVLATPPWTRPRSKEKPVRVELPVPATRAMRWADGERAQWTALAGRYRHDPRGESWPSVIERLKAKQSPNHYYEQLRIVLSAPEELARPLLPGWSPGYRWGFEDWGCALVGKFETDVLDMLLDAVSRDPSPSGVTPLMPMLDAGVVALMAEFHLRRKGLRRHAIAYFARHGATAVPLLVPAALGADAKARSAAESALRLLARQLGDDAVLAEVVPQARAGIGALLARDPLTELPARLPKVGEWADPALLPQVRLAGGQYALPLNRTADLLTMLAIGKTGEPYAGMEQVKEACAPQSLSAFAWGLFQRWQAAGYPSKDSWVMAALGLLGDDDVVRSLAPLIRAWPGEGGHARAVAGLDVLTDIGTDVALLNLNSIAQKVKFAGLKHHAQEKIAQLAADLNLSAEQLADRLVPDFGLSADGSMVLDYGPRQFTVGFDEQLKPFVSDMDGTPRKVLPKPSAKDDQDLAPDAYKRFSGLKKDVKAVAADQIRRLEQAMVTLRRWSAEEFSELFVAHPLLWHVVRRLVWAAYTEDGAVGFRVAEDRSLADSDDETFTLPEGAVIGVAHPLHLGESLAAWAEVFADYEILQPFPQLGRPMHALTDDERAATDLKRFENGKASTGRVLTLVRRGWERGTPQDAGVEPWILKPLADGRVVVVDLDPGIAVGDVMALPDQEVRAVYIDSSGQGYYWGANRSAHTFASLDPVVESELIADLNEVFGK
ncbi:DUF4132 domain-containing protein [Actinokineospora guangxiensis]|uniref:DUF4132 domain-containing protein n=1 Tax=Actinokineospora guangxiensis TaxID=1490288 RepID=A0ABW0EL62_9PSEU